MQNRNYSCGNSPRFERDSLLTPMIEIEDRNTDANIINFLFLRYEFKIQNSKLWCESNNADHDLNVMYFT